MKKKTIRAKQSKARRSPSPPLLLAVVALVVTCLAMLAGAGKLGFLDGGGTPAPTPSAVIPTPTGANWWQVYFTDPNTINDPNSPGGSIEEKLIERINKAQRSIHIAAFEFNLTPIAEVLITAHQRGVDVKWITDDENGLGADSDPGRGQFAMLKKAGIPLRDDGRAALMHDKFIIFDGESVWTGSTNLTVNDIFKNNNNVIVIESQRVASIYESQFADMWAGLFGPSSPSNVKAQRATIDGTSIQVLFSPEDQALEKIIPLINNAQESIRFMAFSYTYADLGSAMLEKAKAGVEIKGIFESRGSETKVSQLPRLYCAGLAVRQDGNPRNFHHKVLVIDGRTLVTGSLNFTNNADQNNNENVVILDNPAIAAQYLAEFERRWAEAVEPNRQAMNCK